MKYPLIIIGGGLSGLAAGIRCSRYIPDVLILEKHSRLGGLNSYYYRNKQLFETGLHAITNFAEPKDKHAPLNRLLRQLKIKREQLKICPQIGSEIRFHNQTSLFFSNDFNQIKDEIARVFPSSIDKFELLLKKFETIDPFAPSPFSSARKFLDGTLQEPLLTDMLLCPLMYYGSSVENDMDLGQFIIMFTAIFKEGMFRPEGTIKDFIEILSNLYKSQGGTIRKGCGVKEILRNKDRIIGVTLENGEVLECDHILSTIGHHETLELLSVNKAEKRVEKRLGFVETIYQLPIDQSSELPTDRTIIFYNNSKNFSYQQPKKLADYNSGVICFPQNFSGVRAEKSMEVRSTHLANFSKWKELSADREKYLLEKQNVKENSAATLENLIGKFHHNTVYSDTFTPVTVERYTSKIDGAIYGSPNKIKDGNIGFENLFLAGTDQGFLGIIGSMLSGVSIANQHILPKL